MPCVSSSCPNFDSPLLKLYVIVSSPDPKVTWWVSYKILELPILLLLCVFTFWIPYCAFCYDLKVGTMFGSCLPSIVYRRDDVLFICICLHIVGSQHVLCCVFLRLVYHMLPVFLDCPFLIAPSVFPNVYMKYCHHLALLSTSVTFLHFNLLQNHLGIWHQTWWESALAGPLHFFFETERWSRT